MESYPVEQNPDDPRSVLAVADQKRRQLAASLRLPGGLQPALAVAIAVQVGTAACGIASQTRAGLAVALAGVAVFLGVVAFMLFQFRRINGVRVDGLASQMVLGTATTSTLVYTSALVAATWAAFQSHWWLVAAASVAGGVGYSFGALRWWTAYQRDPASHARGASPRALAALSVLACLGLVALLINH
ncbi:hypothetical protein SAMN05892883_2427 [Jatrophihabitans sp. GAS493]|uniref:hypothetical protein n=1 Tax=Jatrophihabitans sp. GAS493 TaxID=1907575 RepID=UPI000BBFC195|nr:hypothetical protein [Jatrophihabitans sp. GAS493]SOD73138.1 hypothetical protein SAMN05892883_2427 [Jatrophihabitans sp. GAS493]